MFLLSFFALVVIFGISLAFSEGSISSIINFIDIPTLLIMILIIVPVLIQTGLLKDFNNSFRLTVGRKAQASFKEIKRAIEALQLVRKITAYTAVFIFCFSIITIMHQLSTPESIGPNLALAILSITYAAFLDIILLPMEKQLEVRLIEFDQEEEQKEEEEKAEGEKAEEQKIEEQKTEQW